MLRTVKSVIAKYDPELAVSEVRTMDEVASASIAEPRFRARLLSGLAALALSLSAIGVFGVLAFSVAQRRREFGVRMALGAQIRDVLNLVLGRAAKIVLAGIAIGTLGAVALAKSMSALLFGIRPFDLFTFVAAPALLTLVAQLAAWIPAMRAARTNPAVVLRQE
jgi:putative ABC transport system permease protein